MEQESPREEIERARRGDRAAFAGLVRRHERTALAIAYAIVGDASTAGDVTQEAFLRVWQRLGELNDVDRFGGWLGRIVRNLAADHVRSRKTIAAQDEPVMRLAVDPLHQMEQKDRRRQIDEALADLDELTRAAVVLRYYENLSSKQIGELLELSPPAVDMRLSRGRAQLKEKLSSLAASLATRSGSATENASQATPLNDRIRT